MKGSIFMILIPLPSYGFDPTEVAVPWFFLINKKEKIVFATPDGNIARGDQRLLTGDGFGLLKKMLMTESKVIEIYETMIKSMEFLNPIKYSEIKCEEFEGLILPGGHDPGMKSYLESEVLQKKVASFYKVKKPIGAICHGVVLAARSKTQNTGKSVLYSYKTTALLKKQEMSAYYLTCLWLKSYYRTYSTSVQEEVISVLKNKQQFCSGKITTKRDSIDNTDCSFVVKDRHYVSARWPGDANLFIQTFYQVLIDWRENGAIKN